jgi:hypothetical protein
MRMCLRSILPKSSVLLCVFVGKRTQCKGYSWRYVSCLRWEVFVGKAVHNWMANVSLMMKLKWRCGSGYRQRVVLVKRWDNCINVGGGHVEKSFLFQIRKIICFMFYIHLWPTYWLSLVCFASILLFESIEAVTLLICIVDPKFESSPRHLSWSIILFSSVPPVKGRFSTVN